MHSNELVLVAVAEADIRNLIQAIIVDCVGAKAVPAQNGEEALLKAMRLQPSLILLELHRLGVSRYNALERLKACAATRAIPVMALSTWDKDQERAMRAGCCDFIEEPFDIDLLVAKVEHHLAGRLRMAC